MEKISRNVALTVAILLGIVAACGPAETEATTITSINESTTNVAPTRTSNAVGTNIKESEMTTITTTITINAKETKVSKQTRITDIAQNTQTATIEPTLTSMPKSTTATSLKTNSPKTETVAKTTTTVATTKVALTSSSNLTTTIVPTTNVPSETPTATATETPTEVPVLYNMTGVGNSGREWLYSDYGGEAGAFNAANAWGMQQIEDWFMSGETVTYSGYTIVSCTWSDGQERSCTVSFY